MNFNTKCLSLSSEDSYMYIKNRSVWCRMLHSCQLYRRQGSDQLYRGAFNESRRANCYCLLDQLLGQHKTMTVPLRPSFRPSGFTLTFFDFAVSRAGFNCWWSMQEYYKAAQFTTAGSATKWVHKNWSSGCSFRNRIDSPQFRSSWTTGLKALSCSLTRTRTSTRPPSRIVPRSHLMVPRISRARLAN